VQIVRPSAHYDADFGAVPRRVDGARRMRAASPSSCTGRDALLTLTTPRRLPRALRPALGTSDPREPSITSADVAHLEACAGSLGRPLGDAALSVPSDAIAARDPTGPGLLGRQGALDCVATPSCSASSRLATVIPFEHGAREIVEWYLAVRPGQVTSTRPWTVMDKLRRERWNFFDQHGPGRPRAL